MRVARYYHNRDIRLEEYPRPAIGPGEVLVNVKASGICGTDVMEWYRIKKGPRILGHEVTGEIAESNSPRYTKGQRVFVSHHVPCEACAYCRAGHQTACETLHQGNYDPGGYSEYIRVPKLNVESGILVLPQTVSYEAGTLIEPLACVIRGQRVIDVREGQTVLIIGSGVSGLLHIRYAKYRRATVIATDRQAHRLAQAKAFGADEVRLADQTSDRKADRVIVCAGALDAVQQAFACVDRKGVILLFAIPNTDITMPTLSCWRNEITVTSSYGAAPADLAEALALIEQGTIRVEELITHRLPLADIQEGFRLVAEAKESLKVVITP